MRALVDTNVLVSAVFFGGVPGRVLDALVTRRFALVLSPEIADEYRRVGAELEGRYPRLTGTFEPVLALLAATSILVDAPPLAESVCDDSDDDKFLAAALAARAEVIVSGDKHLLRVTGWRGIDVLAPRSFLDRLDRGR